MYLRVNNDFPFWSRRPRIHQSAADTGHNRNGPTVLYDAAKWYAYQMACYDFSSDFDLEHMISNEVDDEMSDHIW